MKRSHHEKEMYIINLDNKRIFWFIAITLFTLTFFFLTGYWLGSDIEHSSFYKQQVRMQHIVPLLNKAEKRKITNIESPSPSKIPISQLQSYKTTAQAQETESAKSLTTQSSSSPQTQPKKPSTEFTQSMQTKITPSPSPHKHYNIQVSSHRIQSNAIQLKKKLIKKGFLAFITVQERQSKRYYHVRVGSYKEKSEALRAQEKLKNSGFPQTLLL